MDFLTMFNGFAAIIAIWLSPDDLILSSRVRGWYWPNLGSSTAFGLRA